MLDRIITPYNYHAFDTLLSFFGLTNRFPNLVNSLKNGFRIGVPESRLADSIIPPFRSSDDDGVIDDYLREEIEAQRMDGPFTEGQMRDLVGGHFAACPVHVVTQVGEAGKVKKRIVRNMSYEGLAGYSVNDLIDSDDFPTEWGSASVVAAIVSHQPVPVPFVGVCLLARVASCSTLSGFLFLCDLRGLRPAGCLLACGLPVCCRRLFRVRPEG